MYFVKAASSSCFSDTCWTPQQPKNHTFEAFLPDQVHLPDLLENNNFITHLANTEQHGQSFGVYCICDPLMKSSIYHPNCVCVFVAGQMYSWQSLSTQNSCLLHKTMLMRAARLNQNREAEGLKTKTMSYNMRKCSAELRGTAELVISLCGFIATGDTIHSLL